MGKVDVSDFDAMAVESRQGPKCSVGRALRELPPERAEALRQVMADSSRTHAVIARTVTKTWGYHLSQNAVTRHRNGACLCDR